MANLNAVTITGNLTRDPELRTIPSGVAVCELGVAVNERYKNSASGQWEERPNFFNVTVWGTQAENCAKYLSKGRPVGIQGRLRYESWEKDGQKRSMVKIVADIVQFLGGAPEGRRDDDGSGYRMDGAAQSSIQPAGQASGGYSLGNETTSALDDDIPF